MAFLCVHMYMTLYSITSSISFRWQMADADIAWKIMLNKRTELQEWVNKVIEKGELYASPTSAELEELAAQEVLELTGLHALS